MERICIIGFDEPEYTQIRELLDTPMIAHESLPRIILRDGELLVEPKRSPGWITVSKVIFHSMYENDLDFISALALWGGPCLPKANAMMDCRLKLPCLVRALKHSRFGLPRRGYASPHAPFVSDSVRVAKWGNWHCGENKAQFSGTWESEEPCIIEDFLPGQAVRMMLIGDKSWQIKLAGEDWLKSIIAPDAAFMEIDEDLLEDTRVIQQALGLEVAGIDYIVGETGTKHLLEVNHIPNVTRFPQIWEAYRDYAAHWANTSR
jgi:hypothetical protein